MQGSEGGGSARLSGLSWGFSAGISSFRSSKRGNHTQKKVSKGKPNSVTGYVRDQPAGGAPQGKARAAFGSPSSGLVKELEEDEGEGEEGWKIRDGS